MGLYMRQEQNRTELQKRIAAELSAKSKGKSLDSASEQPDGVEDSAYMENTKTTTSLAWVWLLILFAVAGIIIWLVMLAG